MPRLFLSYILQWSLKTTLWNSKIAWRRAGSFLVRSTEKNPCRRHQRPGMATGPKESSPNISKALSRRRLVKLLDQNLSMHKTVEDLQRNSRWAKITRPKELQKRLRKLKRRKSWQVRLLGGLRSLVCINFTEFSWNAGILKSAKSTSPNAEEPAIENCLTDIKNDVAAWEALNLK